MGKLRHAPRRRVAVLVTVACAVAVLGATPASAQEVSTSGPSRVFGELTRERITVRFDGGRVARGDLLRFPAGHPDLELRPRMANGSITGLQRMDSMARGEYAKGAVAGTNGGYFIQRPSGNPNGLLAVDGRLVGSNASLGGGTMLDRSALGIGPAGELLFDQVHVDQQLHLPDGSRLPVLYLNRTPGTNADTVAYSAGYPAAIPVQGGPRPQEQGVLIVTESRLNYRSGRGTTSTVKRVVVPDAPTTYRLQAGESAVVLQRSAHANHPEGPDAGRAAVAAAKALQPGDPIGVSTTVQPRDPSRPAWPRDLAGALPAGGLLLRDGSTGHLEDEGLNHHRHRRARTAAGATAAGDGLLLTIDEVDSSGVTTAELARIMRSLGATDAVNLDGGGSTTMTIAGRVRNRVSDPARGHAQGLFLYAPLPPGARASTGACPPGGVPPSGFEDTVTHTHGAAIDCLRWWGMTEGMTATTYAPRRTITREAMAAMLTRFLDHAATHGTGRPLPPADGNPFADVREDGVHAEAVLRLAQAGIARGTDGYFRPMDPVTRAQAAAFIARAVEYSTGAPLPAFRDTFIDDNGNEHEASIDRLAGLGVIAGMGGYDVAPNEPLRRAAIAPFLTRTADVMVERGLVQPPR